MTSPAVEGSVGRILEHAQVIKQLGVDGTVPIGSSPAVFRQHLVNEINRYRRIVQENNIKAEEE